MFGQRRICGASYRAPVVYPDSYLFAYDFYVHRKADGSLHYARAGLDPNALFKRAYPDYFNLKFEEQFSPPSSVDQYPFSYENRQASRLAQTEGGSIAEGYVLHVSQHHNDNPLQIAAVNPSSGSSTTVDYHRMLDPTQYEVQYPVTGANGAALRAHFAISTNIFTTVGTHQGDNDIYTFPGGNLFEVEFYVGRRVYGRELAKMIFNGPNPTYQRVPGSEVVTGWVETRVARRLRSSSQRIIVERIAPPGVANASAVWTWSVLPYSGPLANGNYYRAANGSISTSGDAANPRIVIATLSRPVVTIPSNEGAPTFFGSTVRAAASVDGAATFRLEPIVTASPEYRRDETPAMDPVWNLWGGKLRINHERKLSLNSGAWFTHPQLTTLGDRWARAVTLTSAQVAAMTPLTPP